MKPSSGLSITSPAYKYMCVIVHENKLNEDPLLILVLINSTGYLYSPGATIRTNVIFLTFYHDWISKRKTPSHYKPPLAEM